mgnify:CR=1 FL=1
MSIPPLNNPEKNQNNTAETHEKTELINIEDLKPAELMDIKDILSTYTQALSLGKISRPIIIEDETNVIIDGYEIYYTLHLLSAKKAPVIRVKAADVKLKPPTTVKSILEAGLKGPKMPPKSIKTQIKVPEIEISLSELLPRRKPEVKALRVYSSTLELLYEGWPTPLVKLKAFSNSRRSVWAKLEGFNPFSNSVKDRMVYDHGCPREKRIKEAHLRGYIHEYWNSSNIYRQHARCKNQALHTTDNTEGQRHLFEGSRRRGC